MRWDNPEETVVLLTYFGNLSLADYYESAEAYNQFVAGVNGTFRTIADMSDVNGTPQGLLTAARNLSKRRPANQACIIGVGFNPYLKCLIDLLCRLMPDLKTQIRYADTVAQARLMLKYTTTQTTSLEE